jgi:high-affinity iron transporter
MLLGLPNSMVQTFLTGLREGLEAALIVGIMVAFVVRSGRKQRLRAVWLGVGAAVVASLGFAGFLSFTARELPGNGEAIFAGITSVCAVGFVTWMVFWMRGHARHLTSDVQGSVGTALSGGAFALAAASFLAVAREGLETALFLWPTVRAAGNGAGPVVGAFVGLALAVVLGVLVYKRSVKLNMQKFFRYTSVALIVIAAGVLAHAMHEFQEIGWLPGDHALAYNFSFSEQGWLGSVLKGTLSLTPSMTWLGAATYVTYLAATLSAFLRKPRVETSETASDENLVSA